MSKLNIPPTKSNLLRMKHDLAFARDGFEMLDQKRQILVLELIGSVEAAKRVQEEVRECMAEAFRALRVALVREGAAGLACDAAAPQIEHGADVTQRSLMGIYLPTVHAQHPELAPTVSLLSGSPALDDAAAAFHRALASVDRLAEVENTVIRLAREVRKTQRRVNALEKVFIPSYEGTIGFIGGVLEERERDEFVIMRLVKQRLERARSQAHRATEEGNHGIAGI